MRQRDRARASSSRLLSRTLNYSKGQKRNRCCCLSFVFDPRSYQYFVSADVGVLQRIQRVVGNDSWTREIVLSARTFGADEALNFGEQRAAPSAQINRAVCRPRVARVGNSRRVCRSGARAGRRDRHKESDCGRGLQTRAQPRAKQFDRRVARVDRRPQRCHAANRRLEAHCDGARAKAAAAIRQRLELLAFISAN